ncbi:hypothetical protein D3C83_196130 [compost metagenome]
MLLDERIEIRRGAVDREDFPLARCAQENIVTNEARGSRDDDSHVSFSNYQLRTTNY